MRSILFALIISSAAYAERAPLTVDTMVTSSAEILNSIQQNAMAVIKLKYQDLQKNMTRHFVEKDLLLDCSTSEKAVNRSNEKAGFRISQSQEALPDGQFRSVIIISHHDCKGDVVFNERIQVVGKNPAIMTSAEAAKFVRTFEVNETETSRQYELEDQGSILLSINSLRSAEGQGEAINTTVSVKGATWLEINQLDLTPSHRRLLIKINAGTFLVGNSNQRFSFKNKPSSVIQLEWTEQRIDHFINDRVVDPGEFDQELEFVITKTSNSFIKELFSQFIKRLPVTVTVQGGATDTRFFRDLQKNAIRMQTNTEQEQVKQFLQRTIELIKTNQLKVEE